MNHTQFTNSFDACVGHAASFNFKSQGAMANFIEDIGENLGLLREDGDFTASGLTLTLKDAAKTAAAQRIYEKYK